MQVELNKRSMNEHKIYPLQEAATMAENGDAKRSAIFQDEKYPEAASPPYDLHKWQMSEYW